MELKTLKDLTSANDFDRNKFGVRNGCEKLYSEEVLRASAIEDIKELNKKIKNDTSLDNYNKLGYEDIINYIMDKFNISEEDLK